MSQRGTLALLAVLGSPGCKTYATVDEACKDHVPGEKHGSADAVEAFGRLNCYRRFLKIKVGAIDPDVSDAVEAHMSYLIRNDIFVSGGDPWDEDPDLQGFTGVDLYDRLDAFGYPTTDGFTDGAWQVILYQDRETEDLIDETMHSPYIRDVYLQPSWTAVGWASGQDSLQHRWVYANILYPLPTFARLNKPVVYPRDEQLDVPPSYTSEYGGEDPMAHYGDVGYPITITVGSTELSGGSNIYELHLLEATLEGPDGPVETLVIEPQLFSWGPLLTTVIIVPVEPLHPSSTYSLDAKVKWNYGERRVQTTFHTGTAADAARGVPRMFRRPLFPQEP